jgi:hypothetical protein
MKTMKRLFDVEATTTGCSESGLIHYEQLLLGQVLKARGPCTKDRSGPISLQPAIGRDNPQGRDRLHHAWLQAAPVGRPPGRRAYRFNELG